MSRLHIATVVCWLLLAAYVIYRCFFTSERQDYVVLFACWCGGVLSLACFLFICAHRREHQKS